MGRTTEKQGRGFWTLHHHDARDLHRFLAKHSSPKQPLLTATITSPPYGSLKDYGHARQIGFGQAYEQYLEEMESVFSDLNNHTKADGSLWLIADTYMAKGSAPRPLMPVPFDLAAAAEAAGWTLRDVIIWRKDRTLPWSNGTRLRNAFEYVLLLVKGPEPKYRLDRLRDHFGSQEWWVRFPERYNPKGKAPPNVWDIPIPVQGNWGNGEIKHSCPLPPELVERLILLSSDEGDVICDPFAGSGVVIAEAERLGRRGIGLEIVKRNVGEFERIIRPEILARNGSGPSGNNGDASSAAAKLLVNLRILKLPVVLMRRAAQRRGAALPLAALALPMQQSSSDNGTYGAAKIVFIVEGGRQEREEYLGLSRDLAARAPASKFGLESEIEVIDISKLRKYVQGRRIYIYRNGATSRALRSVGHKALEAEIRAAREDSTPPVLSNIHVDVAPRPESALAASRSGAIEA